MTGKVKWLMCEWVHTAWISEDVFKYIVSLWLLVKYGKELSNYSSYLLPSLKLYSTSQPSRRRWRKRKIRRKKSWRWLNPRWKIWLTLSATPMESRRCLRILPPSLCHLSKRSKCFEGPWTPCTDGEGSRCCRSDFCGTCAGFLQLGVCEMCGVHLCMWRWVFTQGT